MDQPSYLSARPLIVSDLVSHQLKIVSGALGPGGNHPTNTGGGQLSSYYMWGMTPLSEAIIQIRGQGGERQLPRHDLAMVSGNGGVLEFHSTLVLGAYETRRS
jgi:hypothetical protein